MTTNVTTPDGFVRLANGKLRPKRYTTLPTSLKATELSRFAKIRQQDDMQDNVRKLSHFINWQADYFSEMARSGYKDTARRWYFQYKWSGLERIFKDERFGLDNETRRQISEKVGRVMRESHPEEKPNFENDLRSINYKLELIFSRLPATALPSEPIQNLSREAQFNFSFSTAPETGRTNEAQNQKQTQKRNES